MISLTRTKVNLISACLLVFITLLFSSCAPKASKHSDHHELTKKPKGTFAYISSSLQSSKLMVFNLENNSSKVLFESKSIKQHANFSYDGKKIAYTEADSQSNNREIFIINSDGSSRIQLTNNNFDSTAPSWLPDNRHLVYLSNKDGKPDVYKLDIKTNKTTKLTNNNIEEVTQPRVSPDGSKIVFLIRDYEKFAHLEMFSLNVDGTNFKKMVPQLEREEDISYSFDGKILVFSGHKRGKGSWQIYIKNLETNKLEKLTSFAENLRPDISLDGKLVTYSNMVNGGAKNYWRIGIVRLSDKKITYPVVSKDMVGGSWFTDDGEHIVYNKLSHDKTWDLWISKIDGSHKRNLTPQGFDHQFSAWLRIND